MGLLEQEIKELREMAKLARTGKLNPEMALIQLGIYSQSEKRAKHVLKSLSLAASGAKMQKLIYQSNLIGEGASIDMNGDDETETVRCPGCEKYIARHECLDISGGQKAYEECEVCEHFAVTRQKLLPKE